MAEKAGAGCLEVQSDYSPTHCPAATLETLLQGMGNNYGSTIVCLKPIELNLHESKYVFYDATSFLFS